MPVERQWFILKYSAAAAAVAAAVKHNKDKYIMHEVHAQFG